MQNPIVFTNRGQRLFGMLHLPEREACGPFPALVMLHGFTGNHIEPHRLFVKAARRFAAEGIAALRFDFRGCGDSEGDFKDLTMEGLVSDALAALAWIRGREEINAGRVGLLGFSLGGAVAARAAVSGGDPACLVLWAAVADLQRAFHSLAPEEIAAGYGKRGIHDYRGHALSQCFLEELLAFSPLEGLDEFSRPALIVHGGGDDEIPPEDAETFKRSLGGSRAEVRLVPGADHVFSSLAWERELIGATADFLKNICSAGGGDE